MSVHLKPELSKATRMMVTSRLPLERMVEKQRAKIARLDERIGALMTQRVDEEDLLAELLAMTATRHPGDRKGADE
jgi:septal ring factor EnvC (AmiA/AmiB activator)